MVAGCKLKCIFSSDHLAFCTALPIAKFALLTLHFSLPSPLPTTNNTQPPKPQNPNPQQLPPTKNTKLTRQNNRLEVCKWLCFPNPPVLPCLPTRRSNLFSSPPDSGRMPPDTRHAASSYSGTSKL
jgi:hypothetical protein